MRDAGARLDVLAPPVGAAGAAEVCARCGEAVALKDWSHHVAEHHLPGALLVHEETADFLDFEERARKAKAALDRDDVDGAIAELTAAAEQAESARTIASKM